MYRCHILYLLQHLPSLFSLRTTRWNLRSHVFSFTTAGTVSLGLALCVPGLGFMCPLLWRCCPVRTRKALYSEPVWQRGGLCLGLSWAHSQTTSKPLGHILVTIYLEISKESLVYLYRWRVLKFTDQLLSISSHFASFSAEEKNEWLIMRQKNMRSRPWFKYETEIISNTSSVFDYAWLI